MTALLTYLMPSNNHPLFIVHSCLVGVWNSFSITDCNKSNLKNYPRDIFFAKFLSQYTERILDKTVKNIFETYSG